MNRTALLTLALAAAAMSAVAIARQPTQVRPLHHGQLDANHDSVIDRAEAAKSPRLAARFDQLDKNHDGRLAAGEHSYRSQHGDHHGKGGIARLDANADGRIGRDEISAKGKGSERLAAKFVDMDGNHDGYLVRSELRAYGTRVRSQRMAEHAKRFDEHFATSDLNRDGKLSRIEVSEKMPQMTKGFAWMDENHDGFLSREEMRPQR